MSTWRRRLRGLAGMAWRGRRSFSQFGEDLFVLRFFEGQVSGTWVDIGAFHPRVASNTLALRRAGWRGINVDADPEKMRLFRAFRRGEVNITAAVAGPGGGTAELERAGGGSYGSMDRLRRAADGAGIATRTIDDVLTEAGVGEVDFVSIDVEGLEPEILEAFPFDRLRVQLFCVEVLDWTLDGVRTSRVTELMGAHGYQVIAWTPPSVFFGREPRPAGHG